MKTIPLILFCVLINAAAQLFLKAGMNRVHDFVFNWHNIPQLAIQTITNPFIFSGLCLYVAAVVIWLIVLSRADVSWAYPIMSLAYILTAIAGYFCFNENLSVLRIIGIAVIMLGVYLIAQT